MARKNNETGREDTSKEVFQRDKLKKSLNLKSLKWTDKQKEFIRQATSKETKIMLVKGPAGSAKTLLSVYCTLSLMDSKKLSELIYLRSTVQSKDGEIGFIKGDLDEKMQYLATPLHDKLQELLPKDSLKLLAKENRIQCFPTSVIRGYNFAVKGIVLDEAQNLYFETLVTAITRIAEHSKMFIIGDVSQNDLGKRSGFNKLYDIFDDDESKENGIVTFEFDTSDIMREDVVRYIVEKIKKGD